MKKVIKTLPLTSIILDEKFQPRKKLNKEIIESYSKGILNNEEFPPIIVRKVENQDNYLIISGSHTYQAHFQANFDTIKAEIIKGSDEEMLLLAIESNNQHGLRYNSADKRRCIKLLTEIGIFSIQKIAQRVDFCEKTIKLELKKLYPDKYSTDEAEVVRNGKPYKMNTKNIGSKNEKSMFNELILQKSFGIIQMVEILIFAIKEDKTDKITQEAWDAINSFVAFYTTNNKEV